jgi:hypothetical protein
VSAWPFLCAVSEFAKIQNYLDQSVGSTSSRANQKLLHWPGPIWKFNKSSLAILCVVAKLAKIQNCFEESVRTLLLEPVQNHVKLAGTNMGN